MAIVKTDKQERWGVTVHLPFVGDQTVHPETGEFEVEDDQAAEQLVQAQPDFYIKGEEIDQKSEEDELNQFDVDGLNGEEGEELSLEEKAAIVASLPEKTLKQLQELARPFPGKEWRQLAKEALIAYLAEKLK